MMTVREVSKLTGLSVRALQYYDRIGLLHPAERTEAGYRLYDENDLERLQQIMLFRELAFPLQEIRAILTRPDFDRTLALEQQIVLLELRRDRLEELIALARQIKDTGGKTMDFKPFDTKQIDEYAKQAREAWGDTPEYREFERRGSSAEELKSAGDKLMDVFRAMGAVRDQSPDAPEPQRLVKALQDCITEHFYTCSDETLSGLGQMYASGNDFTKNIDRAGGPGTAAFAAKAIEVYCRSKV